MSGPKNKYLKTLEHENVKLTNVADLAADLLYNLEISDGSAYDKIRYEDSLLEDLKMALLELGYEITQ